MNPANALQVLTGANDYACSNIQGFYASNDGGSTWTRTCLNSISGDFGEGDPGVAYDLTGKAYISGIDATNGIVFESSTNNGATWSAPKVAVKPFFSGGLTDKPWMEVDTNPNSPWANGIYMSVTQFDASETNIAPTVSHSFDGGNTWVTKAVDTTQVFPNVDQFTDLAIGTDGTVYVSWMRCTANGPSSDCGRTQATFYFSKSTDGGNTWSAPVVIATAGLAPDPAFCCFYGMLPNTTERVSDIPVIAIDNSNGPHKGSLYVTYYSWTSGYMKLYIAISTNGGTTWKSHAVLASTLTHDTFFPWINVGSSGQIGLSWMDRRNDPANVNYEAFAAFSGDGGKTFPKSFDMSAAPSDPFNDGFGGSFIGDYTGNAWDGFTLYTTYTDTTTGIDQDFLTGVKLK